MKLHSKSTISILAVLGLSAALLTGSSAQASTSPTRYISLSSSGTVKVTPDAVRLNATVSLVAGNTKDALASASTSANAVRTALTSNGIAAKDIKTTSLTVYPEYNYTSTGGSVLIGYRASQSFDVVIRNAKNAGPVVDAVVAVGSDALQINGVTPFVLNNDGATEAARVAAIKSGRTKALSYAKLLGVKLGPIMYMEEASSPTQYPGVFTAMAKSDAGATTVDLGQQDVTVSVNLRWYIA